MKTLDEVIKMSEICHDGGAGSCEKCLYQAEEGIDDKGHVKCLYQLEEDQIHYLKELKDKRWISVKDRLPNYESVCYIVAYKNHIGHMCVGVREFQRCRVCGELVERWTYLWGTIANEDILFWMPLPEIPEMPEEE